MPINTKGLQSDSVTYVKHKTYNNCKEKYVYVRLSGYQQVKVICTIRQAKHINTVYVRKNNDLSWTSVGDLLFSGNFKPSYNSTLKAIVTPLRDGRKRIGENKVNHVITLDFFFRLPTLIAIRRKET